HPLTNLKTKTRNQKLEIRNWKLEIRNWKLEIRNWKLEIGNWKFENRKWKMETSVLNRKFVKEVSSNYRGPAASRFSLRLPLAFSLYPLQLSVWPSAFKF